MIQKKWQVFALSGNASMEEASIRWRFKKVFGENIRRMRVELYISQRALGERIGVTGAMIYKIETGGWYPSTSLQIKLSCELGTTVGKLHQAPKMGGA